MTTVSERPDRYRWMIVAAGAFMGCVAIGSIFSLPVFLEPMSVTTGWSRTAISLAMTFNFLAMGVASFGWGMMTDRFGPRIVLLAGSSILGLGLVLASRASSVEEFQLFYGVLVGAGGGAIFAPLMATVTGWFDRHRSLAVSLVSAGMGVAPLTVAPIAARLVSTYDWRFSQLLIGLAVDAAAAGRLPDTPSPRPGHRRRGGPCGRDTHDRAGRFDIAAIRRAGPYLFPVLCNPFRSFIPHRELCDLLRPVGHRGCVDLQCGGTFRPRRPHRVRLAR